VLCRLIALAGTSPGLSKARCAKASAGGFYDLVRAMSCLMKSNTHFVRALYVCILESSQGTSKSVLLSSC